MPPARYAGKRFVFATMHGKEAVVRPAFARHLAAEVETLSGVDTDRFGTFTGEIPREGTPAEAALRKARLAAETGGSGLGIGSEGSFGPDPAIPFLPLALEHLAVVDLESGLSLVERIAVRETNFAHVTVRDAAAAADFLARTGFPGHGVIVRAADGQGGGPAVAKGITDPAALEQAVAAAVGRSAAGLAQIETDMRAHLNPTRMAVIGRLAERLAERLARPCPACAAPGWGPERVLPGLPCECCGTPTALPRALLWRCAVCAHTEERPADGPAFADPGHCPECNP